MSGVCVFLPLCVLLTTMTVISATHTPVIMTNSTASTVSRIERPQHTAFLPAILSVTTIDLISDEWVGFLHRNTK